MNKEVIHVFEYVDKKDILISKWILDYHCFASQWFAVLKYFISLIFDDTVMLPTYDKTSIFEVIDRQNNNICNKTLTNMFTIIILFRNLNNSINIKRPLYKAFFICQFCPWVQNEYINYWIWIIK